VVEELYDVAGRSRLVHESAAILLLGGSPNSGTRHLSGSGSGSFPASLLPRSDAKYRDAAPQHATLGHSVFGDGGFGM